MSTYNTTALGVSSSHARVLLEWFFSTLVEPCTSKNVTKHRESDCDYKEQLYEHSHHKQEYHWSHFLQSQQDLSCTKK